MTIKQSVEQALRDYPHTRDSDEALAVAVWWLRHPEAFSLQDGEDILKVDSVMHLLKCAKTTERLRRKFQEKGMYEASEAVKKERGRMAEGVSETINDADWANGRLPT